MNIDTTSRCSLALLRPQETSWEAFGRDLQKGDEPLLSNSEGNVAYNEYFDTWIDKYRERVEEIADDAGVRLDMTEYEIYNVQLGRKRRRHICNNDVITTLDPTADVWAFLTAYLRTMPQSRLVIAYSSHETLEKMYPILGAMKIPTVNKVQKASRDGMSTVLEMVHQLQHVPRCFAFYYKNENGIEQSIRNAFSFPHINAVD